MDRRERILYHQIHPLKLFTDIATAAVATMLLWGHRFWLAMIVGFVPSIAVTIAVVRWSDLEPYRRSVFGRYVHRFMTRRVELARFVGLVPLWVGAWLRRPGAIVAGVIWIAMCWLWGFVGRQSTSSAHLD